MVRFTALSSLQKRVNRVLVVGSIETLQSQGTTDSFLQQTLVSASSSAVQFNSGANPPLLQHALDTLNPSADSGSTSELLLAHETGGNALHVTLHALPTQVSRSNSLARPHSIASFVKSHNKLVTKRGQVLSKDESVLVVLMLPGHTDTWFAAGAAVARVAPLYEHKLKRSNALPETDSKSEADKLEVVYQTALTSNESSLVQHTADAIQLATRLVDAPPNELHSDAFIAEARAVAHRTNSKISVIQGEELRERGFGGIYGVGKAATHKPALVCLSHVPEGAAADAKGVALVGEGIIFDTGGLSIKTGGIMVGMKRDMGGAASLLAAFEAACHAKNTTDKTPLHVVLCIAENSVGPDSTRVDDVLVMYSGKTVEVNNTDAEGRLVLGDGVAYAAKHLNPKVIVDMATLTGAQGISTGYRIGAIYSNDGDLEDMAVKAGKISGDLVHPMPYAPEFHRLEFKSTIADMKNSVKNRANAQVSCAGQFIANHLGDFEHTGKWLHVDMAFPVFTGDDERSTGFGVAFIQSLLKEIDGAGW
ncbi:putative aminopeptidase [Phytophthora idaei]|nr:putative aminopeptidase [Phytophthora idaei]KAG3126376.1 putative aminopeptidase [Phytophthora idaei]KAG3232433.1 putative aminopeptidase [Phytophthora idaei]